MGNTENDAKLIYNDLARATAPLVPVNGSKEPVDMNGAPPPLKRKRADTKMLAPSSSPDLQLQIAPPPARTLAPSTKPFSIPVSKPRPNDASDAQEALKMKVASMAKTHAHDATRVLVCADAQEALKIKVSSMQKAHAPGKGPSKPRLNGASPCADAQEVLKRKVASMAHAHDAMRILVCADAQEALKMKVASMEKVHALGEGPDDFPEIAVLPEIVSPVLSTTRPDASTSASAPRRSKPKPSTSASASASPSKSKSRSGVDNTRLSRRAQSSAVPTPHSTSRLTPISTASTPAPDAPVHAPLHRPRAPRVPHEVVALTDRSGTRGSMRELDAARGLTPARIGVLGGPPPLGVEGAAAWLERVKALAQEPAAPETLTDGQNEHAGEPGGQTDTDNARTRRGAYTYYGQPNTAPTAAFAALLEEAFGPGSVLRGEGAKPVVKAGKGARVGGEKKRRKTMGAGRSASEATTVSVSEAMDVDVDIDIATEENVDADANAEVVGAGVGAATEADGWIAMIQMVVKGKRKIMREDLKLLAETLTAIGEMSAAAASALGDDALRLRESIQQLAQLEDEIPFGDEHGLRTAAKWLLAHWPEGGRWGE